MGSVWRAVVISIAHFMFVFNSIKAVPIPKAQHYEYTYYKEDNKVLAKDKELVKIIRDFVKTRPEIKWGGDFGGGQGTEVAPRGILEFHHFEIQNSSMPTYFEPYAAEIQSVGYTDPVSSLTNTKELAKLYSLLLANSNRAS